MFLPGFPVPLRTIFLITLFVQVTGFSQNITLLRNELKNTKHDTSRLRILNVLVEESGDAEWPAYNTQMQKLAEKNLSSETDPVLRGIYSRFLGLSLNNNGYLYELQGKLNQALASYGKCLPLLERSGDRQGEGTVVNNIGMIQLRKGNANLALKYFDISLRLMREINDSTGIGRCYNNIGLVYDELGDLLKALEFYQRALQIREKMNDHRGISSSYQNIGGLYMNYKDYDNAEDFFLRALKLLEKSDDLENLQLNYNNLGGIYYLRGNDSLAIIYFSKAIEICDKLGYEGEKASPLNNIGYICLRKNQFEKALDYFFKVLSIRTKSDEPDGMVNALNNIAETYLRQNQLHKALEYGRKAYLLACELKRPESIRDPAMILKNTYERLHQPDSALKMFKIHLRMRDSINNASLHRATMKKQLQYDYGKKAQADSLKAAGEKILMAAQLSGKKQQRHMLNAGLALTVLFGIFMLIKFRETKKQKNIISDQTNLVQNQKLQVELKQKEVLDSIRYARRIQSSMLPSEKYLRKILKG